MVHYQSPHHRQLARAEIKQQKAAIICHRPVRVRKVDDRQSVEIAPRLCRHHPDLLDGDNMRHGLQRDLGLRMRIGSKMIRRVGK